MICYRLSTRVNICCPSETWWSHVTDMSFGHSVIRGWQTERGLMVSLTWSCWSILVWLPALCRFLTPFVLGKSNGIPALRTDWRSELKEFHLHDDQCTLHFSMLRILAASRSMFLSSFTFPLVIYLTICFALYIQNCSRKPGGKRPLSRSLLRWVYNIKVDLK
jgi:hypothetical protein